MCACVSFNVALSCTVIPDMYVLNSIPDYTNYCNIVIAAARVAGRRAGLYSACMLYTRDCFDIDIQGAVAGAGDSGSLTVVNLI